MAQPMHEISVRPVSREDLLFTVEIAPREASKRRPEKRVTGDRGRLKLVAPAEVALVELCGMRCFGSSPGRSPMVASNGAAGRGG